jgi:hypothetical protein
MAAEEQEQQHNQHQQGNEQQQEGDQQEAEAGAGQQKEAEAEAEAEHQQGGNDEAAQWAAWREWQQHNPHGTYAVPGGAADDSYARYMRPEDHYWEAVPAQQLAEAASAGERVAAGGPLAEQQQTGQDEAAEQALGLIAGYGSDSDQD